MEYQLAILWSVGAQVAIFWSCRVFVPRQVLVQAIWRSKAKGLFPPDAECRRRGL